MRTKGDPIGQGSLFFLTYFTNITARENLLADRRPGGISTTLNPTRTLCVGSYGAWAIHEKLKRRNLGRGYDV